ncbi:MAG: carboxypeptidase-like regulatory domain-containing protein [Terracidiphilus sp.]
MPSKVSGVTRYLLLALLGAFLLTVNTRGFGQDTNASLSGTVTDPSNAAIPGAKLTLTNVATAFKTNFVSDASGEYSFQNLTPGRYDLAAEATGFKSSTQRGIQLAVNQSARIDVHLSVGNTAETVTVIGDASLINYDNPTLEGGISPETLQDFPLTISGAPRSSATVAVFLPGVSTGGGGNAYDARINGGLVTGDEAVVDGATAMEGFMNQSGMVSLETDFGMSPDITSEVHVLTSNYDAQYGNTTSGQIIIETKSGGEHFHGAGYEYVRNDDLNATPYGGTKPPDKENDFGANVGGPIFLPKMHGANSFLKGYFYFNWEGFQDHGSANSATLSLASANDRNGNFSAWGSQLYYPNDPAKYGADAGTPIAYQGVMNQINPAYEDPVAAAWIAAMPTPTNNGEINNYYIPKAGQGSLTSSENVYFWRTDFNVGSKDHLYYTYWWQYSGINTATNLPLALSTASPANPENAPIQRLNWEHNFSNVMTNHLTLGYLNRNEGYYALNGKANLPKVLGVANPNWLPQMSFGSYYSQLGNSTAPEGSQATTTRGTRALNDVLTRVFGRHTLKAGFEWRSAGTSIHETNGQGGTFTFNADTTGTTSAALCPEGCPGDPMASFYLGAVGGASVSYYNVHAEYPRQYGYAAHLGDSWRVSPKLTLNYSLRWDYVTPFKEKFDNLSFFDPLGPNPDAVTADGTELKGRLAFAGNKWGAASYGADYPEVPEKANLAPRVGFAYSINDKTVVRAGYGIYFGQAFYPGWGGGMSQDGFNKNLNLSESPSGGFRVPALYLTTGISAAQTGSTASNINSGYDNGTSSIYYRPLDGNKRPYSSQWNMTIERQLPHNFFAQVSYVGTKGTHLPSALSPLNVLNPGNSVLSGLGSDLDVSYTSANGPATFAADGVSVPYVGWADQMTGCSPTIGQALLPYPQYCGDLQGDNEFHGNSIYNSFQGRVERHITNGLYLLGSLTVAKLYSNGTFSTQGNAGGSGNTSAFSPYNISRAWALAPDNVPITGQIAVVYDLPFGTNKLFLNGSAVADKIVGGWQVSPIYRYEYGTPFSLSSSTCQTSTIGYFREGCVPGVVSGQQVLPHGRNGFNPANGGTYLNPAAFEGSGAFTNFGYTGYGKAVTTIYGPSYSNLDVSLTKNTKITERANFKLSANFFNSLNNHALISQGNGPGSAFVTDVANPAFGTWNGDASAPRSIQFAGRIEF